MKIRGVLGLLLWLPALAFAQQPYYGTRAASVRVSEGADPSDLDRIPLRTGDIISPENVRAGIQALFDTGRYRTVDVDAASSATGTDLTFNVSRHYFFGTFTLKPENLLGRPLSTLVRLPVGQKYSEGQVQEIREEAQRMLKEAGYFDVPLTVQSRIDSERLHADQRSQGGQVADPGLEASLERPADRRADEPDPAVSRCGSHARSRPERVDQERAPVQPHRRLE